MVIPQSLVVKIIPSFKVVLISNLWLLCPALVSSMYYKTMFCSHCTELGCNNIDSLDRLTDSFSYPGLIETNISQKWASRVQWP